MGAFEPANGQDYRGPPQRGDPASLHGQPYGAAIDNRGNADCENGQRGFPRRLARFSDKRFQIVTDAHTPGNQGPTYKGRARVPRGQSFTREPENPQAQHE
jgi:phospholipid/cholesterol/gamma-HCH transport system substrate-binding protein